MAIKYKAVGRGQPGVTGGGEKKYYAQAVSDGELNIRELVKEVERFSALSEPDIRGVIIALLNVIIDNLGNGKIIRLEELGSLQASISSDGMATEQEVSQSAIRDAHVVFRPGMRIKNALKAASFQKV